MSWSVDDNSPSDIRSLLERRGLALKKRWGQNFMVSPAARRAVVEALDAAPGDRVWEIGPGLGAITAMVLELVDDVTVFEVDWGLIDLVKERFKDAVRIVPGDAVDTIPECADRSPDLVVGNLPYRSAAAIVTTILENDVIMAAVRRLVFTVQREMAARFVASPSTKDYSPLSVLCQLNCRSTVVRHLGKGHFYPAPEVVSSIAVLEPVSGMQPVRRLAARFARALFSSRRKTISNNVEYAARSLGVPAIAIHDAIVSAGIDVRSRAEVVPPATYLELAAILASSFPQVLDPETSD